MINLEFNNLEDKIWTKPDGLFDWTLDLKYRLTDFSKNIVKCIDNSEVINKTSVNSPYLGIIPYENISKGAKTLICMKYTDKKFGLFDLGENCYDFIVDIARSKDIYLVTNNVDNFYKYTKLKDYQIKIVNTGIIVNNDNELWNELFKLHEEEYNRS